MMPYSIDAKCGFGFEETVAVQQSTRTFYLPLKHIWTEEMCFCEAPDLKNETCTNEVARYSTLPLKGLVLTCALEGTEKNIPKNA